MKHDAPPIGNQTSCWTATPTGPFDYALAQGFDAFEWFPDKKPGVGWDDTDLTREARRQIRHIAQERGLRLSVHARWQANPLTPETHPLLERDLDLARDIGAVVLNIHLFHEQGLPAFVEALQPLIQQTADAGIALSIENTPHHAPEHFNDLFHHLQQRVPSAHHVGMCLDVGHANLCTATRNDYLRFVDRLSPHVPIVHLHLHENWGDADTHLPLFTGPSGRDDSGIRGLLHRLRGRGYRGSMILEQWPHPPSLLDEARVRLQQVWSSLNAQPALDSPVPGAPESAEHADSFVPSASHDAQRSALRIDVPAPRQPAPRPGGSLTATIVAGNCQARSWREKLDFARSLLARAHPPLTSDDLIDLSIYLRFLGSGQLTCTEDGRHFRPAHHARLAAEIREQLVPLTNAETVPILRRIYPWLPSSAPEFLRPEPLTRIRDIAHRNDINSDLKHEIKTTLQNKLHRCAGPEDLATSAALLQRITATGSGYPAEFIEQFRIFHQELQEFFNAQSLHRRLDALRPKLTVTQGEALDRFQRLKSAHALDQQLPTLAALTDLRRALTHGGELHAPELRHECQLADIALEDFAFTLLSEWINRWDPQDTLRHEDSLLEALLLAMQNLRLSGIEPDECSAINAELRAWGASIHPKDRDAGLRLKATLLRNRRLIDDLCHQALARYSGRVGELGRALGVAEHAIRMFAESEIRSHLIFQISKILSPMLRRIRQRLRAAPWDIIVPGHTRGQVRTLESLETTSFESDEPIVALLNSVTGDEEVPAPVKAIVILRELPHLSHLAVRARQAGVVLVTCEEPAACQPLQSLAGKWIAVDTTPDQFSWRAMRPDEMTHEPPHTAPKRHTARHRIEAVSTPLWLPLDAIDAETGGAKADSIRRLGALSRSPNAGFKVPAAIVVPFGVMETALAAQPNTFQEYQRLVQSADAASPDQLTNITQHLHELVQTLTVPEPILREGVATLGMEGPLMVRSSAHDEDLEACAGAGLYESVLCTNRSDISEAIRQVWSSLWTRRATWSRRQPGISQQSARMAVLIQNAIAARLCFVLHTVNPVTDATDEMCAEMAIGLGETLVSANCRGSPYRMTVHKTSGEVTMLAFANFSQALILSPENGLHRQRVDYSQQALSLDARARESLARQLAAVAQRVETALGGPQDIEGALTDDTLFLVQSRPQMGVGPTCQP